MALVAIKLTQQICECTRRRNELMLKVVLTVKEKKSLRTMKYAEVQKAREELVRSYLSLGASCREELADARIEHLCDSYHQNKNKAEINVA